ncbi:hypothetical protein THO17_08960 [Marinomonas sp. THO17]
MDLEEFEKSIEKTYQRYFKTERWLDSHHPKPKYYLLLLKHYQDFGLYHAFSLALESKDQDCRVLNNTLFQISRHNLLLRSMLGSGMDHTNLLEDLMSVLACNDEEALAHFLPAELEIAQHRHYFEVASHLIKVLYYQQTQYREDAYTKAEKFLTKKSNAKWEIAILQYLMAIGEKKANAASQALQDMCDSSRYTSPFDKDFAANIHGYYQLARLIDNDLYEQITRPTHKCFCDAFAQWQDENHFPKGEQHYLFPSHLQYMNQIFQAPLPTVTLEDERKKKQRYQDVDQFAADLTLNIENKMKP